MLDLKLAEKLFLKMKNLQTFVLQEYSLASFLGFHDPITNLCK